MWKDYRRFLTTPPRLVVEWTDEPTGARGWLVINSLRAGASGGGTRMRKGVTREEVTYLAKSMQMKFSFSGPPIGGAKSGIDFDPRDPRKHDVLRRWLETIQPYLATCYGTGGDVNVDEQREIVPLCRELGLLHHQQGIMVGHLGAGEERLQFAIQSLHEGIRQPVDDARLGRDGTAFTVSDVITGYGVVQASAALSRARGFDLAGQRVVIEGFGNVGGSAALYYARNGAKVVSIIDAQRAAINEEGFAAEEIEDFLRRRDRGCLPDNPWLTTSRTREKAYHVEADIFVPAAISGSIDQNRLLDLRTAGVHSIICGANQPFRETLLGETDTFEAADHAFDVVPDCVASMGMARAFHHFMSAEPGEELPSVFDTVRETMAGAVNEMVDRCAEKRGGLVATAISIALDLVRTEATDLGDVVELESG